MPREKESYRDNLERIDAAFPGKEMLNKREVAKFVGCSERSAAKMFEFNDMCRISKAKLARAMS